MGLLLGFGLGRVYGFGWVLMGEKFIFNAVGVSGLWLRVLGFRVWGFRAE